MDIEILIIAIVFLLILILIAYLIVSFCKNVVYETLIEHMENMENGTRVDINEHANIDDPYTQPFVIPNLLSHEECDQLINYCSDKLEVPEIGGGYVNIKNNQQCWIPKDNSLVKSLIEKIAKIFELPFKNAEDILVMKYLPNQYYNNHHDSCCDINDKCKDFVKRGGQRILSVLIYLNKDFDDGQTYFKNSNLTFNPEKGHAIVIFPLAQNSNKCHPMATHSGLSAHKGIKWIMNIWFRENTFV